MKTLIPESIRWYTIPDTGMKLPSVTSVLQLIPDDIYIEKWKSSMTVEEYLAYMDKVFTRGDIIHKLCENHFNGTYDPVPLEPEYQPYVTGFHRFLALHSANIVPYFTEERIECPEIGIA